MRLYRSWQRQRKLKRMARQNNIVHTEGHLGGFVQSSANPAPSGLDVSHGDPATWTPQLWDWCVAALGVTSVLDVGCGEGHCAHYFASLGCKVTGVDGSATALQGSKISDRHFLHDFQQGPFAPAEPVDLIWSCEFVEHVYERYCKNFLHTFSFAKKYLMVTYAPPGQLGWHHVNCQPAEYWIERMQDVGCQFSKSLTRDARGQCSSGHFKTKGLVFVPE